MKNNMLMTIVVIVIAAGAAFFGGMKYQQSQVNQNTNGSQFAQSGFNGRMMGQRQGRTGNNNGRAVVGDILSQDANSITVKLQDGSSKIVNIESNTTYSKTSTASASDLKTGERIAVFGAANSDGSVNAQSVQLNPRTPSPSPQPTQ